MKNFEFENIKEYMMGPNALTLLEESLKNETIKPNMKILDLGCGMGLTSLYLAKKYGVTVYAVDLWISATDNFNRFKQWGIASKAIPLNCDAHTLPFANEYFDCITSVDSYHYFGRNKEFFEEKLMPLLKTGGKAILSFPGLVKEFEDDIPKEMLTVWTKEDIQTWHSCSWWQNLLKDSKNTKINVHELNCNEKAWQDWLKSDNEYAKGDKKAMEAGAGKHMNFVCINAEKI